MTRTRGVCAALAVALAVAALLLTGTLTVRGWDWAAGTNTHYCGVYWPHMDFYCETAR